MTKITWHTEQRRLGDLIEWEKNPRFLSEQEAGQIKRSLDTFGVADPLIINTDNRIIGGHQRKKVIDNPDEVIDVRVPDRELTEHEAEELSIRLNKNQGEWDFDLLEANFESLDLIDWGFTRYELGIDNPQDDVYNEWEGMPEYHQEDIGQGFQTIKVHFVTEDDVKKFSELIGQNITYKTKYIWYPKQEALRLPHTVPDDESQ